MIDAEEMAAIMIVLVIIGTIAATVLGEILPDRPNHGVDRDYERTDCMAIPERMC